MILIVIIGILWFIFHFISSLVIKDNVGEGEFILYSILGCILVFALIAACLTKDEGEPKAIDVYNNKTTLKITFQDSIPVDTIVVFKNKDYERN